MKTYIIKWVGGERYWSEPINNFVEADYAFSVYNDFEAAESKVYELIKKGVWNMTILPYYN
jgi:hypothetical protein